MTTVRELAQRDPEAWHCDPFLDGARDGSLSEHSFARWLEQDRLFVCSPPRRRGMTTLEAPRHAADRSVAPSRFAPVRDQVVFMNEPSEEAVTTEPLNC